ncbi:RING-H2 finger protein ATL13-like [Iris pallida]|uniref:RING-type E3 ubiquitin transferase n=1 Tax=Iris pallida TaxID=29817 RepID=A0AAX6F274_IRIPA|nr:RING-H2 finger protein ATL13-like [Iris pallida]
MEPEASNTNTDSSKFSSSLLLLVVVVLAVIFFVSGLLHVLLRCLLTTPSYLEQEEDDDDGGGDVNVTAMQGQLQQLFRLHDSGVDQSFIDALPVFPYAAIAGGLEEPFDCAVCLCEFEPGDKLRLLTGCGHAFHVGCIDTWLLAHSTCPLCRSGLLDQSLLGCGGGSACESSRLSVASSVSILGVDDDKLVGESEAKEEEVVVEVRLGKFRNVDAGVGVDSSSSSVDVPRKELNDQRRCFSMGSYEYVMDESSSLRVAVKPFKKRQLATSECDCHSRRQLGFLKVLDDPSKKRNIAGSSKRESFSVSKIWLRKESRPMMATTTTHGEGSRRAVSFRLPPPSHREPEMSMTDVDAEAAAGICCSSSTTTVCMESQVGETPSFARRTLQWIVNKNNRVGSHV